MTYMLKPLHAGKLTLNNRLVMPPMATSKAYADGKVSQDIIDYYAEKSAGGYISLIIIEHSFIQPEGKASEQQMSIAEDSVIEGLRELAEVIHKNGSKAVMQINHAGSAASEEVIGVMPVGPSAAANPRKGNIPRELTIEEIKDIIKAFAAAALRVKEAGFDGVEIHSAHGYLLNQFFSPLANKRVDEYGGSVYNRIRIHLKVIEAVRAAVGQDFPILLRLGASDFMEGGTTIEDSQTAAKEFEKAGISILDISGGFSGYNVPDLVGQQGYFAPLTEAMKKVVSIPVILTGGITEINAAEQLLADGKADLIGVGRAILKDSKWARDAIESMK
ncbi:MAG: NADH:flavin oxidoreductase/NADH oxidase [Clostridia bacterium]|jgi:2,4-dienoyl-CoA reductase-like NADH-dependent reductase (Old Yellow Enzyme family)|nr:NADH:flavin oxidoreductase/NADH oxidase [Clostridia bacterium]